MKGSYSYIDIAREDLRAAGEMLRAGLYNHAVRLCQQYVEKVLKECLEKHGAGEEDLRLQHSHRVFRLAERAAELRGLTFTRTEKAFFRELTDYYFDTNYPGEDYIEVTALQAAQAHEETLRFQTDYEARLC